MRSFEEQKKLNGSFYWTVISLVALSCGAARAQMNSMTDAGGATNSVVASGSSTNVTDLGNIKVVGRLDQARSQILPDLGATAYTHTAEQIQSQSQGDDAPINQVILRSPGVAGDNEASDGLHVRGEHANLQYRINDVLLPEGIAGFGSELDPRFIDSMQLITGSLPAQYGFRTAGIVNIQTKSGVFDNGGTAEVYGGSFETIRPSFDYSGSSGKWNYFFDGSYDQNALGIENPTASHDAIHDTTRQGKGFGYLSYVIDDTSRITLMGSGAYSTFEIPNTPGLPVGTASDPGATPWNVAGSGLPANFSSASLDENQREQNYYGVIAYQKSAGDFNSQISLFGRGSAVHFTPDPIGDLYFNGVASDVARWLYGGGLQGDASYALGDHHTLRGGVMCLAEFVQSDTTTTVFPVDGNGTPTGPAFPITDNGHLHGLFSGAYLQDEWKIFDQLTLNYGARLDDYSSSFDNEWQLSPRINLIWQPTESTTLHAGYSRYFTPPPVEDVSGSDVKLFNGTSNESATDQDDGVRAERANYYDVGISQKVFTGLTVGLDGYYKRAHEQLDDGLFGQTLILSAFNYRLGEVFGGEFTANYVRGGFSTYANVAVSEARGEDWNSAQFLFDPADAAYVHNHWIYLDHDQFISGSFGAAYTWKEGEKYSTRAYVDAIYGSGLRTDATDSSGETVPNGGSVPSYYSLNLGVEQSYKLSKTQTLKARLDVVNVTDNRYELRDGAGVGVNAASYGERLGFFGSVSFIF